MWFHPGITEKIMDNWRFNLAAAALLLAACAGLEPADEREEPERAPETKSVLALRSGSDLSSLAVWIYTGKDTTFVSALGNGLVATCAADEAKIFAAGNLAGMATGDVAIHPRADTVTANLSLMTPETITCSAYIEHAVASGTNEIELSIPRDICKISLQKVENRITEGAYAGKTLRVEKIFLINGIGRYRIFSSPASASFAPSAGRWWFCPSGVAAENWGSSGTEGFMAAPDMSYATPECDVAYEASVTFNTDVYTCPNDTETDAWAASAEDLHAADWAPRKTRLVLQCLIDGHRCYYPLTIDSPEANCHYIIRRLVITRFGTDFPDQPYDFTTGTASITIADWSFRPISEII